MARTKKELINDFGKALTECLGKEVTRKEAEKMMAAAIEQIVKDAKDHGGFVWPNFGKIEIVEIGARKGRNPKTGVPVEVAAHKKIKLSPSSVLQKYINNP